MSLAELKKQLTEKYEAIKKIYKGNQILFNIKKKDIDELYANTIKSLDGESNNRKNNIGKYGLFSSEALREKQYGDQLKKISDTFYQKTQSIDPKYILAIEEEFQMNKKNSDMEQLEKQASRDLIDMSGKGGAVAIIDSNDKKLMALLLASAY
jgi:hypothetical protein